MPRIFVYDNRTFPDPGENLTVEQVKQQLAQFMPELGNAQVQERKEADNTVYEFQRRVGTKG